MSTADSQKEFVSTPEERLKILPIISDLACFIVEAHQLNSADIFSKLELNKKIWRADEQVTATYLLATIVCITKLQREFSLSYEQILSETEKYFEKSNTIITPSAIKAHHNKLVDYFYRKNSVIDSDIQLLLTDTKEPKDIYHTKAIAYLENANKQPAATSSTDVTSIIFHHVSTETIKSKINQLTIAIESKQEALEKVKSALEEINLEIEGTEANLQKNEGKLSKTKKEAGIWDDRYDTEIDSLKTKIKQCENTLNTLPPLKNWLARKIAAPSDNLIKSMFTHAKPSLLQRIGRQLLTPFLDETELKQHQLSQQKINTEKTILEHQQSCYETAKKQPEMCDRKDKLQTKVASLRKNKEDLSERVSAKKTAKKDIRQNLATLNTEKDQLVFLAENQNHINAQLQKTIARRKQQIDDAKIKPRDLHHEFYRSASQIQLPTSHRTLERSCGNSSDSGYRERVDAYFTQALTLTHTMLAFIKDYINVDSLAIFPYELIKEQKGLGETIKNYQIDESGVMQTTGRLNKSPTENALEFHCEYNLKNTAKNSTEIKANASFLIKENDGAINVFVTHYSNTFADWIKNKIPHEGHSIALHYQSSVPNTHSSSQTLFGASKTAPAPPALENKILTLIRSAQYNNPTLSASC